MKYRFIEWARDWSGNLNNLFNAVVCSATRAAWRIASRYKNSLKSMDKKALSFILYKG